MTKVKALYRGEVVFGEHMDLGLCEEPDGNFYGEYIAFPLANFVVLVYAPYVDAATNGAEYRHKQATEYCASRGYANLEVV